VLLSRGASPRPNPVRYGAPPDARARGRRGLRPRRG